MRPILVILLTGMSLAAQEVPPELKATDALTAKVPVSFNDLRYARLAGGIKECREIALVKPSARVQFRVFILATSRHYLKVDYARMTIHESRGVILPKNVVKDACNAVMEIARDCEDCWVLYDRKGKPIKTRQPPPDPKKRAE